MFAISINYLKVYSSSYTKKSYETNKVTASLIFILYNLAMNFISEY